MKITKKAADILNQEAQILLAQAMRLINGDRDDTIIDNVRNVAFRLQRASQIREINPV